LVGLGFGVEVGLNEFVALGFADLVYDFEGAGA
jgi:hypothetical protein